MKTAISLSDDLLKQADQAARQLGLSRSRLFTLALHDYLRKHRQTEMIQQLNQVYGGDGEGPEKDSAKRIKTKVRAQLRDRW